MTDEFSQYKVKSDGEDEFAKYKTTPTAPVAQPTPAGADPELVKRIMATSGVDESEATRRALNTAALLKGGAQTLQSSNEYGDTGSQIGTALENFAIGLTPLGIGRTVEGGAGRVLEAFGWEDNPLTPENIESRQIENPTTSTVANIVGGLTQGGLSLLKSAAPTTFAKLAEVPGLGTFAKTVTAMDITGRAANQAGARASARVLSREAGKDELLRELREKAVLSPEQQQVFDTLASEAEKTYASHLTDAKVERLRLLKLAEEEAKTGTELMTKQERAVHKVFESAAKPTVVEKVGGLGRAEKAAALAESRAAHERAQFVISQNLKDQYSTLGFDSKLALMFSNMAINGALGAGLEGARTLMDKQPLTREQLDSTSESLSAQMLRNMGTGALIGGGLAGLVPVAADGLAASSRMLRKGVGLLAEKILPPIGGLTHTLSAGERGVPSDVLKAGMKLGNYAAGTNHKDALRAFRGSAQYQMDNLESYLENVERRTKMWAADDEESHALSQMFDGWAEDVKATVAKIRKNYMGKTPEGGYKYNARLDDAIMDMKPELKMGEDGKLFVNVELPEPLQELQDHIARFEGAYYRSMTPEQQQVAKRFPIMETRPMAAGDVEPRLPPYPNTSTPFFTDNNIFVGSQPFTPTEGVIERGYIPFAGMGKNISLPKAELVAPQKLAGMQDLIGQQFRTPQTEQSLKELALTTAAGAALQAAGTPLGLPGTLAAKGAYDLFFNQQALINNYATLHKTAEGSARLLNSFASALTRNKSIASTATRAVLDSPERKIMGGDKSRPSLSLDMDEARNLYASDKELLSKITSDDAIGKINELFGNDYDKLDVAYPVLSQNVSGLIPRQVAFLKGKMDSIFKPENEKDAYNHIAPTAQQIFSYALYSRYVRDPEAIYADILNKKYVPDQAIEVLNAVYPATYRQIKSELFNELLSARQSGEKIDRTQQVIVDKLLGRKTGGLDATQIKALQDSMAGTPAGQPSGAGNPRRIELEREGTSQGK